MKAAGQRKQEVAQKVTLSYDGEMNPLPPNVLASARTLAGFSQGGLASRAGITRRTVLRAEQGLPIHDRNLQAILDTLRKYGVQIALEVDAIRITKVAA